MPDNLKKKGPRDRKRQSTQKHEVQYAPRRKVAGTKNRKRK
jgi:hypothetical protein